MRIKRTGDCEADLHGAADAVVGIVVRGIRPAARETSARAFVWGAETGAAPSLPFVRWRTGARAAA